MSIVAVVFNRLFAVVRVIGGLFRRCVGIFGIGRQSARIGELPFVHAADERRPFLGAAGYSPLPQADPSQRPFEPAAASWNAWDDKAIETQSKIAEYRQQLQQQNQQKAAAQRRQHPTAAAPPQPAPAAAEAEPDLFSDLQPTLKAAKTYRVASRKQQPVAPRSGLFEVHDDDPYASRGISTELGDIDLNAAATASWGDESVDLDAELHEQQEQRRREKIEQQRQRREEHERRMADRRMGKLD